MQILKLMMANGQQDKYWGVIAGHLHIWFDGQAFPYTHQRFAARPLLRVRVRVRA
jgi:hypothetical protein